MEKNVDDRANNNIMEKHWKDILYGFLLFIAVSLVLVITYKTQLKDVWKNNVSATLMLEHKDNAKVIMSADFPSLAETFLCKVPDIKELKLECKNEVISDKTKLIITLADAQTGEVYYQSEDKPQNLVNSKNKITIKLDKNARKKMGNTVEKKYVLIFQLDNPENTMLNLTANSKPGIVDNVNGDINNKTNIIYKLKYSNCKELKKLYLLLCLAILIFAMVSYILLIVKKVPIYKAYIPLALILGFIFNFVIMMHGVPDEPWHIDTAYKYSNKMLFVDDTVNYNTIYKRECDILMNDMLANGVESNSYYQLLHHAFEKPEDVELKEVVYTDTSNMATGLVYIPTAIGISIGRLLGLSSILTISLGRFLNLLVFVLLVALAMYIAPRGKHVFAALGLLPIAMQQGASASYDPSICGAVFIFIALCLCIREQDKIKKYQIALLIILLIFIATVKGGIYLPVCLLLIPVWIGKKNKIDNNVKFKKKIVNIFIVAAVAALGCGLLFIKFYPSVKAIMEPHMSSDANQFYSMTYIINNMDKVFDIIWKTYLKKSDIYISGALGGILGWHDIRFSWTYVSILLIGILLLVNVDGNRFKFSCKWKIAMVITCVSSIIMITICQLLASTVISSKYIIGIQGRYFLPFLPLAFLLTQNSAINVTERQANYVWMGMLLTECMILLQFVTMI